MKTERLNVLCIENVFQETLHSGPSFRVTLDAQLNMLCKGNALKI